MEISFAKRYRIYEKSTIATDYENLLGDKPTKKAANNTHSLVHKENTSPATNKVLQRPLTTALVYKQTNTLEDRAYTSKTPPEYSRVTKRTTTALGDYRKSTNLYYASPVNSDFFDNIRLNELKMFSNKQPQQQQTRPTQSVSPHTTSQAKVPNNVKLKQQILNQYYKTSTKPPASSGVSLERSKSNTTTTTTTTPAPQTTRQLASYLKNSKLTNEEINKYLALKRSTDLEHTKRSSTNLNTTYARNKTSFTHLTNSYGSFNNSYLLDTTSRMNRSQLQMSSAVNRFTSKNQSTRLHNFNTSSNNNQHVLNRSLRNNSNLDMTASFNGTHLKKKFTQLGTSASRPVSDFRLKSSTIKSTNQQQQQQQQQIQVPPQQQINQMKSSSFNNKYFDEKYLKQRTAIQQQQQQQLAKLKTDSNEINASKVKYVISRGVTGVSGGAVVKQKFDMSSDSELNGRINLVSQQHHKLMLKQKQQQQQNYDDDDEDEEEEEEEEEDEEDEAKLNQLLAEDAAMLALVNKKCNEWLEKYVIPFMNSTTSSPVDDDDHIYGQI